MTGNVEVFLNNFYVSSRYSSDLPEGEDKKKFVLENKPKDEYFCSEQAQLNIVAIYCCVLYDHSGHEQEDGFCFVSYYRFTAHIL